MKSTNLTKKIIIMAVAILLFTALLFFLFLPHGVLESGSSLKRVEISIRNVVVGGDDSGEHLKTLQGEEVKELERKLKQTTLVRNRLADTKHYASTKVYIFDLFYELNGKEFSKTISFDLSRNIVMCDEKPHWLGLFVSKEKHEEIAKGILSLSGVS